MQPSLCASLGVALALSGGCKAPVDPAALTAPFHDSFDRAALGPDWKDTGNAWSVRDGALHGANAYNHPVWLNKVLPRDVSVELDIRTTSPEGDLKIELFGDGRTYDPDKGAYLATSYVLIFGGWRNTQSKIARQDEHRAQDPARSDTRVEPGRTYHWSVERRGTRLSWAIDGRAFLSLDDVDPLAGSGHDHLAVGNWETPVFVDNLVITPR